jgi:hypothetical protein
MVQALKKQLIITALFLTIISCTVFLYIPVKCDSQVSVGAYYYVWYDEGSGNRHWNSTLLGQSASLVWNVVDTPLLGYYSSQNTTLVKQHLDWMKELGIDFIIISWWGPNSYEDNATKIVFSTLNQTGYPIQAAVMVEPYDSANTYNFETICNYIYNTFASQYSDIYMKIEDKPLVCFHSDANMTGTETRRSDIYYSDARFTKRIVGCNSYVDWWYGMPSNTNNSIAPPLSPKDNMMCIEPRYDNFYINGTPTARYDIDYTDGPYDHEWDVTIQLAAQNKVNYVTLDSWNQYHERTQIEPHSTDGKYALSIFTKTKSYIDQIKSPQQQGSDPLPYIIVGLLIGVILTWLYYRQRSRESYIKQKTSEKPPSEKEQGEGAAEEEELNEDAHDSTEEDIE